MEVYTVECYSSNAIPNEVSQFIEKDLIDLTKDVWPTDMSLEISSFMSIENRYFDENGDRDEKSIPYKLNHVNISEELKEKWRIEMNDEDLNILWRVAEGRCVLSEHYHYLVEPDTKCDKYLLIAKKGSEYYGGVFLFHCPNDTNNNYVRMQGICKYSKPLIEGLLDKEYPVKLNSLLIPKAVEIAKSLNVNEVRVAPIGKQRSILTKYYGFNKTKNLRLTPYPSETLLQESWKYNTYYSLYF